MTTPVVTNWGEVPCVYCLTPVERMIDFRVAYPCMCGAVDREDRRRAERLARVH